MVPLLRQILYGQPIDFVNNFEFKILEILKLIVLKQSTTIVYTKDNNSEVLVLLCDLVSDTNAHLYTNM